MIEQVLMKLASEAPVALVLGLFGYLMLRLFERVLAHYQQWLDRFAVELLNRLEHLTNEVRHLKDRDHNNNQEKEDYYDAQHHRS